MVPSIVTKVKRSMHLNTGFMTLKAHWDLHSYHLDTDMRGVEISPCGFLRDTSLNQKD